QRARTDRHAALSLIAEPAAFIHAERAGRRGAVLPHEPDPQPVEPQTTATQLHGGPAEVGERVQGRELRGHFVEGGELLREAALLLFRFPQRRFRPLPLRDVLNDDAYSLQGSVVGPDWVVAHEEVTIGGRGGAAVDFHVQRRLATLDD